MRAVTASVVCIVMACAAPALARGNPDDGGPVRVSGASPYPADGCGQVDPNLESLAEGDVAGFAASPTQGGGNGAETDLSIVVDPRDPRRLVAAWVQDSALGFVVARSTDGGSTWTRSTVPGVTVCAGGPAEHVTHARLAWGPDGRLYLAGETLQGYFPDPRSGVNRIPVLSSSDGGRTWSAPSYVDDVPAANGFDTLTAEPDVPGSVVVAWHTPEPVATSYVSRSLDGGRTWTRSTVPGGPVDSLAAQRVVALGNGALVLVTSEGSLRGFAAGAATPTPLVVRRSTDGGRTWSEPARLADTAPGQWAAAAAGPHGRVHVAWFDDSDPCGTRLLISTSADGGASWSAPTVGVCGVVGPPSELAVAPDGTAGVPVTVAAGDDGRQVLVASRDEGATWQVHDLSGPFQRPKASGFFFGAAASPRGFLSLSLQAGPSVDGPTDVFLDRLRVH